MKFTHINRVIHQNRGADDTTRCDDGEADDRGADDTEGDDRGADDASRWGLIDVVCDVAGDGRTFVDEARVHLNERSACV